jgi:glycosyltransferase involved in cell wall biosynthesis
LFVTAYSGLGGGETSLLGLCGALDPSITPSIVVPRDGELAREARSLGIRVHVMPFRGASRWFVPAVWARLPPAARLRRLLVQEEQDVVCTDFHSLPFAAPACRSLAIPVVFHCWAWWFRPFAWQRGLYRRDVQVTVACSDAVKTGFLGDPPFMPADRVSRIYPGVDTNRFRPRPEDIALFRRAFDLPVDRPLVTLVARFQNVKGHDDFLEAAAAVARARPDALFAVAGENVFGGAADESFARRVRTAADASALLRSRVRFLGWVDRPEALLAASDVLVCSSRFETFGMAVIEAMSCSTPVVSTNVGGPAETILDSETGFLVPPGQPQLIAERVLMLLGDETLRRRLGAEARQRVERHFSLSRYGATFSAAIAGVTAAHPRVSGATAR